jgi:hypothetical protein
VEGVNTQTSVKTALHTTEECTMFDVPLGTKTGYWDTAQGVPKQNGDIDYNSYEARNCWVYGPHQWLNQGCVAISDDDESIGTPLNKKGGGVFGEIFYASFIAIAYRERAFFKHFTNVLFFNQLWNGIL